MSVLTSMPVEFVRLYFFMDLTTTWHMPLTVFVLPVFSCNLLQI